MRADSAALLESLAVAVGFVRTSCKSESWPAGWGFFVTANFRSAETPPRGKARLRR